MAPEKHKLDERVKTLIEELGDLQSTDPVQFAAAKQLLSQLANGEINKSGFWGRWQKQVPKAEYASGIEDVVENPSLLAELVSNLP